MNKKTQAKCRGTTLTVGFHSATPPLIWRFDLERNHSFTLSLQGEEGDWELGITSPKGDFYGVAHFSTRDDAEDALLKVEKVLSHKKGVTVTKALLVLAAAALFVIVIVVLLARHADHINGSPIVSSRMATPTAPVSSVPPMEEGVPQSADDVLKPPPH